MTQNIYKDRVAIQLRVSTMTAMGETATWTPVQKRYARVISLDAKAILSYQKLDSVVSHKVVFRGSISLSLGNNRLIWKDKTLELVEPVQELDNDSVVLVKEV